MMTDPSIEIELATVERHGERDRLLADLLQGQPERGEWWVIVLQRRDVVEAGHADIAGHLQNPEGAEGGDRTLGHHVGDRGAGLILPRTNQRSRAAPPRP